MLRCVSIYEKKIRGCKRLVVLNNVEDYDKWGFKKRLCIKLLEVVGLFRQSLMEKIEMSPYLLFSVMKIT